MLFNSYIFILFFFPLCLIGYFGLNHFKKYTLSQAFLLLMSLWFYGYFNLYYLPIMVFSILFNFFIYKALQKKKHKAILIAGLAVNLGVLAYFKYMDFFITNVNRFFSQDFNLLNIVLPLGISFFTFQQLSFVIDSYKGEVPTYSLLHYASFVTYFPQLIAGPIVTHDELVPQFMDESKKKINWDNFAKGIYIFAIGLAKKVLIADTFGNAVNIGYANVGSLDTTNALLVILGYTLQIYFDFSGYCDMAIGIGKMMNIDLPINFNSPYKALTITEFWGRWHMTLTRFFTKYVYIPLGGSRKGNIRTYINIFIVFALSGLWHGAGWTFIIWGIGHGIFSIITRLCKKTFDNLHPAFNWILTFGFINVMLVFFRAQSVKSALKLLYSVAQFNFGRIRTDILSCFKLPELNFVISLTPIQKYIPFFFLISFYALAMFIILCTKNSVEMMKRFKPTIPRLIFTSVLLVWCIFTFSGISTFLYFNF